MASHAATEFGYGKGRNGLGFGKEGCLLGFVGLVV